MKRGKKVKETLEEKHKRFEMLWNKYYKPIYAYCRNLMGSHLNDIDDVVSETFSALWMSMVKDVEIICMPRWLVGTARKKIYKKYGENAFRNSVFVSLSNSDIENRLPSNNFDIDEARLTDERIEEINEKAEQMLSKKEQNLLEMLYDMHMSHEEIADELGTSANATKQRVYRINYKIKQYAKMRLKEIR